MRAAPLSSMALVLTIVSCAAKLPPEPPKQVLSLERTLRVVVVGSRESSLLEADGDRCGASIGALPVVLGELTVTKEMWKYGLEEPPPVGGIASHSAREVDGTDDSTEHGTSLRWNVCVVDRPGAVARPLVLELNRAALPLAFARGQVEIRLPSPTVVETVR